MSADRFGMKPPTFRIHKNVWDNWYGYKGRRRVIAFMNTLDFDQQGNAERWLAERQAGKPAWEEEEQ